MEVDLPAIQPQDLRGDEPFFHGAESLPFRVEDFWRWSTSDLLSNVTRGVLAEYLVACGLGCHHVARVEWDSVDLVTDAGVKIEVKSAAYLQSWFQKKIEPVSFDIAKKTGWDGRTGGTDAEKKRRADVYVFALLAHRDKMTVDPRNLQQWLFYVVARSRIDEEFGDQKKVRLSRLEGAAGGPVRWSDLTEAVWRVREIPSLTGSSVK